MAGLTLRELTTSFPRAGRLEAIHLRPSRRAATVAVERVLAVEERGLQGDHTGNRTRSPTNPRSRRQVTLIQQEHLAVIASLVGSARAIDAGLLRRNLVVSGLNLLAARNVFPERHLLLCIGTGRLELTGTCHPCSLMEELLGPGGYNAMRGHGGVTAIVVQDGVRSVGDAVTVMELQERRE
jgi:MOSC domain-containing protein YiiM